MVGRASYGFAPPGGTYRAPYTQGGPSDGVTPRLALDLVTLDPILPAPVRDYRTLDFHTLINNPATQIKEATWTATTMIGSQVNDPHAQDRLLLPEPIIDQTAQTTSMLFGDGIDGVTYLLVATVDLDDGRILMKRASLTCLAQPLLEPPLPPGAVAFDYHRFITLFPEFKEVSPQQAQMYWSMACEIVRNDGTSPVQDPCEREEILMLLTAHICALLGGPMGGGGFGPSITSTISSKSVNGVSLSAGGMFGGVNGTQAWYHLTRYGQLAWMKLRAYRLFHYVPGGQRTMTNPFSSWPWVVGWHPAGCGPQACGSGSSRRWFLSILPIITGPTGPPGPPGQDGQDGKGGVVDQVSIIGEGTDADPWMVSDVNAGNFPSNNGATGAVGGRGGRGASGPRDDEF